MSDVQLSASTVEEGDSITASVAVSNTGSTDATLRVEVVFSGGTVSKEVYLPKGQSGLLTFDITPRRDDSTLRFSLYTDGRLLDTWTSPISVLYPVLSLTHGATRCEWRRGTDDLPSCTVSGSFTLTNNGTGPARGVNLTLDAGIPRSLGMVSYLGPGQSYTGSWSGSLGEGFHTVVLRASSASSEASVPVSVNVRFPRHLESPEVAKLYITPRDPVIASLANEIVRKKSWWDIRPDWMVIRDWVASNIKYRYDSDSHGVTEYWQLPRETVRLGTGDCEDFAILCCSLLRAVGYGSDEVYVVANYTAAHAYLLWVEELPLLGKMYFPMEPQAGSWLAVFADLYVSFQDLVGWLNAKFGSGRWLAFNDVSVLTS